MHYSEVTETYPQATKTKIPLVSETFY